MAEIEVYARPMCGFCHYAKRLLDGKGVTYTEYNIWTEPGRKEEMLQRSGGKTTVPQIFIDGEHVGGCDELVGLDKAGKLDALLGSATT